MPAMIPAMVGTAVLGGVVSNNASNRAASASTAANNAALAQNQAQFEASQRLQERLAGQSNATQRAIANQQIAAQREMFAEVQKTLSPFVSAGRQALTDLKPYEQAGQDALVQQRALAGLGTPEEQQAAIDRLSGGVEMQALTQQGENAILQNASATGGLRGGNTQAALAQFRPAALSALLENQYNRLGGLTALGANTTGSIAQLGQASAAQQAAAAVNTGSGISNALGQSGINLASLANNNATAMAGINNQFGQNQLALTTQAGQIQSGLQKSLGQNTADALGGLSQSFSTMAFLNNLKGTTGLGSVGAGMSGGLGSGLAAGSGGLGLKAPAGFVF